MQRRYPWKRSSGSNSGWADMAKKVTHKEFYMEIRKSPGRFLSIMFIVALGVAFFSGIRASEPSMRATGDAYFDSANLMDIKAVSTLGITEEDLDAIREIEDVESAEGAYSADFLHLTDQSQEVVHVMSLQSEMNASTVTQGRFPQKVGECLADDESDYQIGDVITLASGTEDPVSDTLQVDSLEVVGRGSSPCYISFARGGTTIGTGSINSFLLVPAETFDLDVYTDVYVKVSGASALTAYTGEYDDKVEEIMDEMEDLTGERGEIRREELVSDATAELDDAKQELEDGKKEAQEELADAAKEIADGEKELADAKKKIADGRLQISDAKKLLKKKQAQVTKAKKQLEKGRKKLQSGKSQYQAGVREYRVKKENASRQFEDTQKTLQEARKGLDDGWSQYHSLESQIDNLKKQLQELENAETGGNDSEDATDGTGGSGGKENQGGSDSPGSGTGQTPEETQQAKEGLRSQISMLQSQAEQVKTQLEEKEAAYQQGVSQLESGKKEMEAAGEKLKESKSALEKSQAELEKAEKQIKSGQKAINAAWSEIRSQEHKLESGASEISKNEDKLTDAKEEYRKGKKEAEEEIADGEKKIADAEQEIADIPDAKWYVYDRSVLPEYSAFGENADRVGAIGRVFPVIFFLVAALISLTSMTRMVEEQRIEIGTKKALGYSRFAIASKYLGYAFLATVLGCILGGLLGEKVLPYIIIYAYGIMYHHIPEILTPYHLSYILMASGASLVCTLGATFFACYKELQSEPANLMRPPAPRIGKRVFLEHIGILWRHMSFTWKSTVRNLMRYKKRFFMTVFGIGGCMALMVVGYGIRDSVYEIAGIQYSEIQIYDANVFLEENLTEQDRQNLEQALSGNQGIDRFMDGYMKSFTLKNGKKERQAYLCVMGDPEKADSYVKLHDRVSKEEYTLSDNGVIMSEKTAKLLDVRVGDTVEIKDEDAGNHRVKLEHICENYMGHYIYMTPAYYEKVYGTKPEYNCIFFAADESCSKKEIEEIGREILKQDEVLSVSYMHDIEKQLNDMLTSLNLVIIVLIISAGMLAFVVLFNLNSINITERQRELATLKVLGFYDMEVAAYVFRENVLLTLIGSMAGVVIGKFLHLFIIQTVEVDAAMFGRSIYLPSYLYSLAFTIGFSLAVNAIMYWKLKKINMVESLKSIE